MQGRLYKNACKGKLEVIMFWDKKYKKIYFLLTMIAKIFIL